MEMGIIKRNMEKNILLELKRIKEIMGVSNNFFISEGMAGQEQNQAKWYAEDRSKMGITASKPTFNIGKGTEYPFIFEFGDDKLDIIKLVEGSKVFVIGPNTTSSTIINGVETGTVINAKNESITNQEYILRDVTNKKNGKKITKQLCLPTKEFWQLSSIQGKVYKFAVKTESKGGMGFGTSGLETFSKEFSLLLKLKKTVADDNITVSTPKKQTAVEASIKCLGGDNGWSFDITAPLFFDTETLKGYNPADLSNFDDRSEFETWYDNYGGWLQVGIGVAAALTGAGLAAILLEATAGSTGAFFAFMSANYMGGSTTVASVILQAVCEGVMMAPLIKWQISDGRTSDATLDILFCLIPFISETKAVSGLISGRYGKETAKNLSDKIRVAGLKQIFDNVKAGIPGASEDYFKFINNLSGTEFAMFNEGMKMFATQEGCDAFLLGFEELVKSGGEFAKEWSEAQVKQSTEKFIGKTAALFGEKAGVKTVEFQKIWAKTVNPFTSRYVIPGQIFRMGAPLMVIAITFKSLFRTLLEPDEQISFTNNVTAFTENNTGYINDLSSIDPYLTESAIQLTMDKIVDDPILIKKFANDPEFWKTEEMKGIYDQAQKEVIEAKAEEIKSLLKTPNGQKFVNALQKFNLKNSFIKVCEEKPKLIGITITKIEVSTDLKTATGTCKDNKGNEHKFEFKDVSGTLQFFIDGSMVPETDFTNEKIWGKETIQSNSPSQNTKVYNKNGEIWKDGTFKNGEIWDGKVYEYDEDGILQRILVYKEGKYYSDGQL